MKNALTITGALLGVALIIFFFTYAPVGQEEGAPETSYEPVRMTLTGAYLCLPHVDTSGPQTLECAFGLQTDDGLYYAIDFALMSQMPPALPTGARIRANGVFVPLERLSTDHWRKYPIEGIFSVTDSVEVME